jgi:hypothetical protein
MINLNTSNPIDPAITESISKRKNAEAVLKMISVQPTVKEQLLNQLLPGEVNSSIKTWLENLLIASQIGADLTATFEDVKRFSSVNQALVLAAAYRVAVPGSKNSTEIAKKLEDLINAQQELANRNYTTETLDTNALVFAEEAHLKNEPPRQARSYATIAAIVSGMALAILGTLYVSSLNKTETPQPVPFNDASCQMTGAYLLTKRGCSPFSLQDQSFSYIAPIYEKTNHTTIENLDESNNKVEQLPEESKISQSKISEKTSPIYLNQRVAFIEKLNPDQLQDAAKILLGENREFDSETYEQENEKYIQKLFKQMALSIHPDKCPSDKKAACSEAWEKLVKAKAICSTTSCDVAEIDNMIKNLNVSQADLYSIASLFQYKEISFMNFIPICGQEEFFRRGRLLSNEQVADMIERFGLGESYEKKDGMITGAIGRFLTTKQVEQAIGLLDFSTLRRDTLASIFEYRQPEVLEQWVTSLSHKQLKFILKEPSPIHEGLKRKILSLISDEQCKEYIQGIDIQQEEEWFIQNLGEKAIQSLSPQQVKNSITRYGTGYAFIDRLSRTQVEAYVKDLDMNAVDGNVLWYIFQKFDNLGQHLSENQIEIGDQRRFSWLNQYLTSPYIALTAPQISGYPTENYLGRYFIGGDAGYNPNASEEYMLKRQHQETLKFASELSQFYLDKGITTGEELLIFSDKHAERMREFLLKNYKAMYTREPTFFESTFGGIKGEVIHDDQVQSQIKKAEEMVEILNQGIKKNIRLWQNRKKSIKQFRREPSNIGDLRALITNTMELQHLASKEVMDFLILEKFIYCPKERNWLFYDGHKTTWIQC